MKGRAIWLSFIGLNWRFSLQFMVSSASTASFSHFPSVRGPRGHWLLGHLPELRQNSLTAFSMVNRTHGDLTRLQMLGLGRLGARFDLHVLSHPDDIAHVLDRNAANYQNAGLLRSRYLTLFGPCILAAEGQEWKARRKLEAPSFSRARLNAMASCVTDEALLTAERWEKRLQQGNASFDMVPELMDLTLRVAGRMLLGTNFGEGIDTLEKGRAIAFPDMNAVWLHENIPVVNRISSPRRRRFMRARRSIEGAMIDIVEARRNRGPSDEPKDILDVLMNARDANGVGWTNSELAGEMHALVRAGQDTTTSSVVWAMFLIARHPEAEARLHEELERVLGGRAPVAADLPNLPFLRAIYDETLRLYPPIPTVARTAMEDDAIRGHFIPKGRCIVLVSWLTHRDPRWWPNPDEFIPDRFVGASAKASLPKYTYFPFGGGSRFCMGAGLALLQGPLVLATLAQKFRMRVAPEHDIRPRAYISVMPDGGLPVTLEHR